MTYLEERVADLRRHLDHLQTIQPRVRSAGDLSRSRSLDNDVKYSLLMVSQRVIDIAGELSARRRLSFEDFSEAIRNLAIYEEIPDPLIRRLEPLSRLRNALIHGNGALSPTHIRDALGLLGGVERFLQALEHLGAKRR